MGLFTLNGEPMESADAWKVGLADPVLHWKPGYSAWALAHCWHAANGLPPEIGEVLEPAFAAVEMRSGLIEHKVPMPGIGRASQTDLMVLAQAGSESLCIAVEGKVTESLGPSVAQWHDGSPNEEARLAGILTAINLPREIPSGIRYQLLHRMASPVIEARARGAGHAVMLIHSFSGLDASFADLAAFAALYHVTAITPGTLYRLTVVGGVTLYAAWVRGDRACLGL